jgi:predicted DNA-binding protein (MmcQ/YjbR family)
MDHVRTRQVLLSQPQAIEDFPFGPEVAVFKIKGKMFATLALGPMGKKTSPTNPAENLWWMNLKCDPQEAVMLRDIFTAVIPGYHMNKVHWNTIKLDGSIPEGELVRMIENSFKLVLNSLPKKLQASVLLHL